MGAVLLLATDDWLLVGCWWTPWLEAAVWAGLVGGVNMGVGGPAKVPGPDRGCKRPGLPSIEVTPDTEVTLPTTDEVTLASPGTPPRALKPPRPTMPAML